MAEVPVQALAQVVDQLDDVVLGPQLANLAQARLDQLPVVLVGGLLVLPLLAPGDLVEFGGGLAPFGIAARVAHGQTAFPGGCGKVRLLMMAWPYGRAS